MKRRVFVQIIIVLLLTSCTQREEQINAVRGSVVSITVSSEGSEEKNSIGTGFFVDKNLLATAFHVYKESLEEVNKRGGESKVIARKSSKNNEKFVIPLTPLVTDEKNDLAIFRFDPEDIQKQWQGFIVKPLSLSTGEPGVGEEITISGYHSDFSNPSSSVGIIAQISDDNNILSDLTMIPGMSGSPLVSLKRNEVVGINIGIRTINGAQIRMSVSTKSAYLIDLIDKAKIKLKYSN